MSATKKKKEKFTLEERLIDVLIFGVMIGLPALSVIVLIKYV
jgi:hypothetical protein